MGVVTLLLFKILGLFLLNFQQPIFSNDSWAYLDISKSIFHDFYHVNLIRQFEFQSEYGISFPLLWPLLISLVNRLFNIGIYAGYGLIFLILILTGATLIQLSQILTKSKLSAAWLFVMLLSNSDYVNELLGARNIILSIWLTTLILVVFLRSRLSKFKVASLAVLAGLLTLNRFDGLLPGLVLGGACWFNLESGKFPTRLSKVKMLILYYSCFFLIISPWIIYSLSHFSRFFVSDNQRTILLAVNNFTIDYFPDPSHLPSVFNQPLRWLSYRVIYTGLISLITFSKWIYENIFIQQLLLLVGLSYFVWLVIKNHVKRLALNSDQLQTLKNILKLAPIFTVQLLLISMTGFLDMRYALPMLLYVSCVSLELLFLLLESFLKKPQLQGLTLIVLIPVLLTQVIFPWGKELLSLSKQPWSLNVEYLKLNSREQTLQQVLHETQIAPVLLLDPHNPTLITAARFAALSSSLTLETPSNINEFVLIKLIENYHVTHVLTACPVWLTTLKTHFQLQPTSMSHLYQIQLTTSELATKSASLSAQVMPQTSADERYKNCVENF